MQIGIKYVVYHPRKFFCACNCESAFCRWIRFQGCFWCGSKLYKTDGKNYKNTPTSIFDDADNLGVMTISDKSDFSIKQSIYTVSWNKEAETRCWYIFGWFFLHKSFFTVHLNYKNKRKSQTEFRKSLSYTCRSVAGRYVRGAAQARGVPCYPTTLFVACIGCMWVSGGNPLNVGGGPLACWGGPRKKRIPGEESQQVR